MRSDGSNVVKEETAAAAAVRRKVCCDQDPSCTQSFIAAADAVVVGIIQITCIVP
jgi:hypothetical protein